MTARSRRQLVDEKGDAGIVAAGERAGGAEEARAHHQPARDVVGPFHRRVEPVAQHHGDADHQQVRDQQQRGDRIADGKQRRDDPVPIDRRVRDG